jgi:cob(I)alamin adenosyltransferase
MSKNNIYLWTGNGAGKSTSAFGTALRCVGQGFKVIIIQFMKGRKDIGEFKVRNKLGKNYQIYQFGRQSLIKPITKWTDKDKKLAELGLEFARQVLNKKPRLLVLDEINLACAVGLLDVDEVLDFLSRVPASTKVYMTGRKAPRKLIEKADFVNTINEVKHPKKWNAVRGIEF